jgi:hypothetical protein
MAIVGAQCVVGQTSNAAGQGAASTTNSPAGKRPLANAQQDFFSQLDAFKTPGRSAYPNEMDREKAGDCPPAFST